MVVMLSGYAGLHVQEYPVACSETDSTLVDGHPGTKRLETTFIISFPYSHMLLMGSGLTKYVARNPDSMMTNEVDDCRLVRVLGDSLGYCF